MQRIFVHKKHAYNKRQVIHDRSFDDAFGKSSRDTPGIGYFEPLAAPFRVTTKYASGGGY